METEWLNDRARVNELRHTSCGAPRIAEVRSMQSSFVMMAAQLHEARWGELSWEEDGLSRRPREAPLPSDVGADSGRPRFPNPRPRRLAGVWEIDESDRDHA
eukprot:gene42607-47662_t